MGVCVWVGGSDVWEWGVLTKQVAGRWMKDGGEQGAKGDWDGLGRGGVGHELGLRRHCTVRCQGPRGDCKWTPVTDGGRR